MGECKDKCGACCRHFMLPFSFKQGTTMAMKLDAIDWIESHGTPGEFQYVKNENGHFIKINRPCRYLSATNLCLRHYTNKPKLCAEAPCMKEEMEKDANQLKSRAELLRE